MTTPFRTKTAAELVHARPDLYAECAEFIIKYPNFCQECGAEGFKEHTENGAPHGAGFWPMPVIDACPSCSDKNICPLCGESDSFDDALEACKFCNWQEECPTDIFPGTKDDFNVLKQFFTELKD